MSSLSWSDHALKRWRERFPGINLDMEQSSMRKAGRKQKSIIKRLTPVNAARYMKQGYEGRYYMVSRSNIVFVVQKSLIITVFHLYGEGVNQ